MCLGQQVGFTLFWWLTASGIFHTKYVWTTDVLVSSLVNMLNNCPAEYPRLVLKNKQIMDIGLF